MPFFMWAIYLIYTRPNIATITTLSMTALLFREDIALWVGLAVLIMVLAHHIPLTTATIPLTPATIIVLTYIPAVAPEGTYLYESAFGAESTSITVGVAAVSEVVRSIFLLAPVGLAARRLPVLLLAPLALPLIGLVMKGGASLFPAFHYDMLFVPAILAALALSKEIVRFSVR